MCDHQCIGRIPRPLPPLVAEPTTAGTGTDVSQFAVITDTTRGVKATLIGKALVPDISLTDPCLLVTMPDWLAATTRLDVRTTNAMLGATHAISHQIGGALDLPHGMLNAILLPHVVRFNAENDPTRFRRLAEALGVPDAALMPDDEVGQALAAHIGDLASTIGAPRCLGEIGVKEPELVAFARRTLGDACLAANPRDVSESDVMAILRAAL